MDNANLEKINSFDENSLPDLDVCVLGALELFSKEKVPSFDFKKFKRPLVVGSGNAIATGIIIFDKQNAVFADEGTFVSVLDSDNSIDGAFLISASGGKHAPIIAQELSKRNIPLVLLTCNPNAEAIKKIENKSSVLVFPKQREPYTYNTSTYMGLILAKTCEDPKNILDFLKTNVDPLMEKTRMGDFDSFYFIVPEKFDKIRVMFVTKFVELFGRRIGRDVFTGEQTKHATTVVGANKELFVSIGFENNVWGENRLNVPLPNDADYATIMAVGYYVIGKLQSQKPPWFKENIKDYCEKVSKIFGSKISPVVENY